MSNFVKTLEAKVKALNAERNEHWLAIEAIDDKLELLVELLADEGVELGPTSAPAAKKRPGRPKGSRNKKKTQAPKPVADPIAAEMNKELYESAVGQLGDEGTTPEMQEKLSKRFNPMPRPTHRLGAGVRAGTKAEVVDKPENTADARVGGEEEDEGEE